MFFRRKAQSHLEYALLISAVVAAFIIGKGYLKRSMQGRLRSSSDQIGDNFEPGNSKYTKKDVIKSRINTEEHHPADAGGAMTTITTVYDQTQTSINASW